MKYLRYRSPGSTISDPSMDILKTVILEPKHDDWVGGDAMLDFYEGDEINVYQGDPSLIFFYDQPYGFFIYYEVSLVPVLHGTLLKDDVVVEHSIGGEPMRIPSICYRTPEETWDIIQHFIATEQPLDKFNWVMLGQIDYEY